MLVLGGCGHVGLPLGLAFADAGVPVTLFDINLAAVDRVRSGKMPHLEPGAPDVLLRTLDNGTLSATADPSSISLNEHIVVVIGTPVDEHLNPDPHAVIAAIEAVSEHLVDGQILILRSTVFPGVTRMVERLVERLGKEIDVAFCPERIAEGRAMEELHSLPQIVSARTDRAFERAAALFRHLTGTIVRVEPEEAELAKLFTNSYRYIKFAAANQLFMMANDFGLDYERIRSAVIQDYPRAADLPGPGFAAGPCLLKDTMQLAAFNNNNFGLGQASMQINEGLPLYLVSKLASRFDLDSMAVGILGMAFKGESDDNRSSLSYKLKRVLRVRAASVLTTDPYVDRRRQSGAARAGPRTVRSHRHRCTPPALRRPGNPPAGRGHLEPSGPGGRGVKPRVSIVIPAYNEAAGIEDVLARLTETVQLPCEVVVVVDAPDDSTVPYVEKFATRDPRVRVVVNDVAPGPAQAIRYGIDHATADVVVVTMADGCDDPQQIDYLVRLVERGVVVAAASRYSRGGQQVGGPFLKSLLSRTAGLSLWLLARVSTRDATNSFKAYDVDFIREVGLSSTTGFEIGIELVAKARRARLPVAEVPTIWLERHQGVSNFKLASWLPHYIRWWLFAFGPRLPVSEIRAAAERKGPK